MKTNWTNKNSLLELAENAEKERVRLFEWAQDFKSSKTESGEKAYHKNMYRCRRLAKIREELEALAESYK